MAWGSSPVQEQASDAWVSGTSFTITLSGSPTDGNFGVIYFDEGAAATTITSISQTGTTWARAVTSNTFRTAEVWYTTAPFSSASTSITINLNSTPTAAAAVSAAFSEWVAPSSVAVSGTSTANATSTTPSSGSATPTASVNALMIGCFRSGSATINPPHGNPDNSFTPLVSSDADQRGEGAYRVVASTSGSYTVTWSTGSGHWEAALAIFIDNTGGGGSTSVTSAAAGQASTTASINVARSASATIAGVANATATLNAIRSFTASANGQATTTASLNVKRTLTSAAAGLATVAAAMNVKRKLTTSAAGQASVSLTMVKRGQSSTGATGQSAVTLTMNVKRSLSVAPQGTASTTLAQQKWRNLTTSAAGSASISATLHARRLLTTSSQGTASVAASLNAVRSLTVAPAGLASVLATLQLAGGTTAAVAKGKYKAEHASALADIRDAGTAVAFTRTLLIYDETTDSSTATTTSIAAYAMQVRGKPETYRALSLVESAAPTLFFAPVDYELHAGLDEFVKPGDQVTWAEQVYTVKDVSPLAPDSVVITARAVIAK